MSCFKMRYTVVAPTPTCSAISWRETCPSFCTTLHTLCTLAAVLADHGLPGHFKSAVLSWPPTNFLCQTRTGFFEMQSFWKLSDIFLQHWMGVNPDLAKNFKTHLCSTLDSMKTTIPNNTCKETVQKAQKHNETLAWRCYSNDTLRLSAEQLPNQTD